MIFLCYIYLNIFLIAGMSMDVYNHYVHCDQQWINAVENFVHLKNKL